METSWIEKLAHQARAPRELLSSSVLFYGIGNPGRQDDALGPSFVEWLDRQNLPSGWKTEVNYQLNAEDALLISQFEYVCFVDASQKQAHAGQKDFLENDREKFYHFDKIGPSLQITFSTHAMTLGSIVGLCHDLYACQPKCAALGILGSDWEIGEGLSSFASENLRRAQRDFENWWSLYA